MKISEELQCLVFGYYDVLSVNAEEPQSCYDLGSRCLARLTEFAPPVAVPDILWSPSTGSKRGRTRGPRELIKMRELNTTACAALYDGVDWSSLWNVITLIILAIVDVMVVVGNVLVILAVYSTSKLRNVTNMFIVSLAVADLMVGVAVLPFSATWEVYKVRSFSDALIILF